jgi:type IV pilus assembly protein PilA
MIRIRPPDPDADAGFTLIELLVVMIIIGILAAIAIPVYLNMRQQAWDATSKSDVEAAAKSEEQLLVDTGSYGDTAALSADGHAIRVSHTDTVTILLYNGAVGYCLSANAPGSPRTWYYDSVGGGMQPNGATGCPVTTTGTAGGSVTG